MLHTKLRSSFLQVKNVITYLAIKGLIDTNYPLHQIS